MTQPPEDRRPERPADEGGPENEPTVAWTPPEPEGERETIADEGGVGYAAIPEDAAPSAAEPPPAPPAANMPTEPPVEPRAEPPAEPLVGSTTQPSGPIISATPAQATPPPVQGWQTPAQPTPPAPPPAGGWTVPAAQHEPVTGLVYSATLPRFIAYVFDLIVIAIVTGIIGGALGWSNAATAVDPTTGAIDISRIAPRPEQTIVSVLLSALYFIASWTGGRRATLGQRIFQIQVGNAADGRPLRLEQGIRRWLGLGAFLDLLALVPGQIALSGLSFLWAIVLLITTATSPTKQGLHDKFADSAVARPAAAGNGMVIACLLILVALIVLPLLAIIALIGLGSQVSTILSQAGESI